MAKIWDFSVGECTMLIDVLTTAVNAIVPIVLLIGFGYWLRRSGVLSEDFMKQGNKLMFNYLLPCMLMINTYKIDSFSDIPLGLMGYSLAMVGVNFLLGLAIIPRLTADPRRKGVLLQSTFRSNTAVIGIPLAQALGGAAAVATATVSTAICVPLLNVLAVISLTLFVHPGQKVDGRQLLRSVLRNPLIRGIGLGFVCILLRTLQRQVLGEVVFTLSGDLKFLYTALSQAGSIATPFALIILGGQFSFSAVGELRREIAIGTIWREILAPLVGLGGAVLLTKAGILHVVSADYPALIALFGTPTAVSSAAMAAQMDNDTQLATQLVVWTSIVSIPTLFLAVCVLMLTGLLVV